MRAFLGLICLTGLLLPAPTRAADASILKILPHLLDSKGRHTLSPSLYERDAYQAHLRNKPELISSLRFDIQWKPRADRGKELLLKLELRGGKAASKPLTISGKVKSRSLFTAWTSLTLSKEQYESLGGITAWRATLWDGEKQLHELRSFLW